MMKRTAVLLHAFVLAGALPLAIHAEAAAQVSVGAHGTLTEIRGRNAAGLGGRLTMIVREAPNLTLAVEGVGEYLWPSCDVADCEAVVLQANLLGRRRVASYAEAYGGIGFVYQDYTVGVGERTYKGDDIGMTLLVGTQSGAPGGIRPFLEARFSIMKDVANQFGASLGLRIPVIR